MLFRSGQLGFAFGDLSDTAVGVGDSAEDGLAVNQVQSLEHVAVTVPLALAGFGLQALRPASQLARRRFSGGRARALFAGAAAHSIQAIERAGTSSFALVLLALGHVYGWPVARGGSQRIADALASYLLSLGGEIETGAPVDSQIGRASCKERV